MILNLLLFALKYNAGVIFASLALITDAWQALSDSLTFGIKMPVLEPDTEHPFGMGVGNEPRCWKQDQ